MKTGSIVAVCISATNGLPKWRQDYAVIDTHGLVGDYHNREVRESFSKPGTMKPNDDRHITIVAREAAEHVEKKLSVKIPEGGLAENILVSGLGDLSDVADDSVIIIGRKVRLIVTGQNQPCRKVKEFYSPAFAQAIAGRRGLLCRIESGVGETICEFDRVCIYDPPPLDAA